MEDKERFILQDELRKAIESGEIENATPKDFQRWMLSLISGAIPNDMVRHNAINLALTANHYRTEQVIKKLEDTIKKLNAANDRSQKVITYLTIIATLAALMQIVMAIYSMR